EPSRRISPFRKVAQPFPRTERTPVALLPSTSEQPAGTVRAMEPPPDMPIPDRLNVALVVLDVALAVALIWLASWLAAWYAVLAVGVVFSYLMLTNYALLHEATHHNLHSNPRWNYWLGVATGVLFGAPYSMIRVTHQGHHQRNRTDAEMFDLYYEGD